MIVILLQGNRSCQVIHLLSVTQFKFNSEIVSAFRITDFFKFLSYFNPSIDIYKEQWYIATYRHRKFK